jgi:hypothetical protein
LAGRRGLMRMIRDVNELTPEQDPMLNDETSQPL